MCGPTAAAFGLVLEDESDVLVTELFDLLDQGPRNKTAYEIATLLRDGKVEAAKLIYSWDGDKVAITVYQPLLEKLLGCRLHGKHNCDGPFCKSNAKS